MEETQPGSPSRVLAARQRVNRQTAKGLSPVGRGQARSQAELEEYATSSGRELQRLLMQDHLNMRTAREERLERVVGADGVVRRRAERGHRRLVATTVGRGGSEPDRLPRLGRAQGAVNRRSLGATAAAALLPAVAPGGA